MKTRDIEHIQSELYDTYKESGTPELFEEWLRKIIKSGSVLGHYAEMTLNNMGLTV